MPAPVEHILVRGVNWLGDAVMTTPALMRLREAHPDSRITILSPEKLAGLWEGQPFLDEVLTFTGTEGVWRISRRLREGKFTAGLIFPNSFRSALELWLAGIPKRVGLARAGRSLLLTHPAPALSGSVDMRKRPVAEIRRRIETNANPPSYPAEAHHAHRYLRLAAALGASPEPMPPRIEISERAMEEARQKFGMASGRPWFGLNPGAQYGPAKRWPVERFAAAARSLSEKTHCRWVIFGGADDRAFAETIANALAGGASESPLNLAGKTNLRELAAALKICDLVLTNDSGPMHLAAAVGAPVTAIFGSTSPELTGPIFSSRARVVRCDAPCAPCFRRECPIDLRCLRGIETEQVVSAALACLAGR
ncbi:MAG TPA: lipopolysaccharide heptosyltransferase II [Verrucomicrobiae bacterium]|jgi:heptosyltransferase-2